MFEYINPFFGIIAALVIFATVLLTIYEIGKVQGKGGKFKAPYFMYGATALLVVILFWDANDSKIQYKKTMRTFNNNKVLLCRAVGMNRLISKKKGWYLFDKYHFSDGDAIIGIRFCEALDEKH